MPYAYTGNNPIQRTDPSGLDFMQDLITNVAAWAPAVLCASDQVLAFMAGAADSLTFGLSSVALSAAVPGYDEFVAGHEAAFTAGSIVATVVQAAVTIVATAGAGAGLAVGMVAVKVAAKAATKAVHGTALRTLQRVGAQSIKSPPSLYRADSRSIDEIFSGGFQAKGDNLDLREHVTSNPVNSGYVSTSKDLGSAQDFAKEFDVENIFELRATGVDVNETMGAASPFPWENEVAVPGGIPGSAIRGAWGPNGWIPNPGFRG